MKQEDKDLLLRDLCARLPYGVRYKGDGGWGINPYQHTSSLSVILNSKEPLVYLRPMSSMTDEERVERIEILYELEGHIEENVTYIYQDWLNKKMFYYRGLIDKGLAIAVTEENSPYKLRTR